MFVLDKKILGWNDSTKNHLISDAGTIRDVINLNKDTLNRVKEELSDIKISEGDDSKQLLEVFKKLNETSRALYNSYILLTDEWFDTDDQNLLKELPDIRLELSDFVTDKLWSNYDRLINVLADKFEAGREVIDRLTIAEIESLLEGKSSKESYKTVANRPFALVVENNKLHRLFDSEVMNLKEHLEENDPLKEIDSNSSNSKMIRGISANEGLYKGRVVILKGEDYKNADSVLSEKEGYVLVTPMTRPEIVPHMKQSGAIVTDEGGITCHAAIISREMNKPCIIGTKVATQILKDGDEVEVDADNGVVRIIS